MSTPIRVSLEEARAALFATQGLAGSRPSSPLEAVERAGFIRTLGGVDVYLALRARLPSLGRAELDSTVESMDLQIVPAVRCCIYLVPRAEVPWALRFADLLSTTRSLREREKAGLHTGEVEDVGRAVLSALDEHGPSATVQLRQLLPDRLLRSLGAAGKKVGISSALPPALRDLEFQGLIERRVAGGRLDTEKYLWQIPATNPFDGVSVPDQATAIHVHMADLFLRAAGIGCVDVFAQWAGLGKRAAQAAFAELDLIEVEIRGLGERRWALAESSDALFARGTTSDRRAGVAFLPFEDNFIALQGGPAHLVDAAHHEIEVTVWGGRGSTTTLGQAKHMQNRSIVVDGQVIGLWEYDPDSHSIVWSAFGSLSSSIEYRIQSAADATSRFIAEELGHGRSFSIDSDDALRTRCAHLRSL